MGSSEQFGKVAPETEPCIDCQLHFPNVFLHRFLTFLDLKKVDGYGTPRLCESSGLRSEEGRSWVHATMQELTGYGLRYVSMAWSWIQNRRTRVSICWRRIPVFHIFITLIRNVIARSYGNQL